MKTCELVDKWQKILGGLLGVAPGLLKFGVKVGGSGPERIMGQEYEIIDDKLKHLDWCCGHYAVYIGDESVAFFKLYELPHCCGVLVSCNAAVKPKWQNRRLGTALNTMRQDIGRMLGYSILLCTDCADNTYQRKLLATNGWKDILNFKNRRTGNELFLAYIGL